MTLTSTSQTRTEVIPEVIFLGKLVDRIVEGKIRIPRFQRAFVWKQQDLYALLDSVLRGFPIGSILVWDTEESIESVQHIGPVQISPGSSGMASYLLDGQQRVSTLVGTLRLPSGVPSNVDQIDWNVHCDLRRGEFIRASQESELWNFPVNSLLSTAGFIAACRHIQESSNNDKQARQWMDEADRLATAFRDYQLPLIHIREASLENAVTVFARLNRTGRKMTADEMVSALTYKEGGFHLAGELNTFKEELDRHRFGNLGRVFLLRAVLAAMDLDIYAKDWARLVVNENVRSRFPEGFELANKGMMRAIVFLKSLGITSDKLLPYGLQVVLLGEFFRLCPTPSEEVESLLRRWFWVTSFTGWFGGRNSTQVRLALDEIRELARSKTSDLQVVDLDAPALPFPKRFDSRSARVRAFMNYLVSLSPRSFSGTILDTGELLFFGENRVIGYVVSSHQQVPTLYSSPANRMFVDRDSVGQACGKLAKLDDELLKKILPSHGFPLQAIDRLRNDERDALIRVRLEALIAGEREFITAREVVLPTDQTAESIADSDTAEDDD